MLGIPNLLATRGGRLAAFFLLYITERIPLGFAPSAAAPSIQRRGANGLMFAGAAIGQAVSGSGVLLLTPYIPFQSTFLLVAASIGLVTVLVVLPMKEQFIAALAASVEGSRMRSAIADMRTFAV